MLFNNYLLITYKGVTYDSRQYPSYVSIQLNGTTLIVYYDNLDVYNPFRILCSALMNCIIIICGIMTHIGGLDMPNRSSFGAIKLIILWSGNHHLDPSITIHNIWSGTVQLHVDISYPLVLVWEQLYVLNFIFSFEILCNYL